MFRRSPSTDTLLERARKRAARIATPDLVSWTDQALFGLGRNVDAYRRSGDVASLTEALEGAVALRAVLEELVVRNRT